MSSEGGKSLVDYVADQYEKALTASEADRKEGARMRDMFTGFGKGQWAVDAKSRLLARGNVTPQINLSRGKIERLAGSLIKNFYDITFIPVSSETTDLTRTLNDTFVADSNTFDYTKSYLRCVVDGLIHQGVEQMTVSTRYNPLGNIVFERVLPGHIIIDPNWKSDDTWDIEEVFKVAYLTPKQIVNIYGHKNDRIAQILETIENTGTDYDDDNENQSTAHTSLNSEYGHKYRVIERHYLETVSRVVKFTRVGDETIDLPEDEDAARDVLAKNNMQDRIGEVITRRIQEKVYRVQTCCKELDQFELLEDSESDIQIGRLPFYPLSAERFGGTNSGIMSLLEDVQKLINSREAQVDDIIASHSQGAYLFDPVVVGNNDVLVEQAIANLKRPDAIIRTAPGILASGRDLIKPVPKQPFGGELYQEIQRMVGYFDTLSGQTSTLDGMKESSHDTGVLFARRAIQSEMALTVLTKQLESHQKDKFESWMLYSKVLYSGAYREVSKQTSRGQEKLELNKREYTESGDVIIQNDLSELPRHKVIVVPSKDGLTVRETDRARNLELLQYVQSPIKRVIIEQNALETLDNASKEKADLRKYNDLEIAVAIERMTAELSALQLQNKQAAMQIQQMGMQNQQMGMQNEQMAGQMQAEGEQPVDGEQPMDGMQEAQQMEQQQVM
jgi:hypothetical protein